MADFILSTMTFDGMISGIRFDNKIPLDNLVLTDNILEIGSNYGYKVSEDYINMDIYKNRIKKKSKKKFDKRGKQGNGTHFNSQITFTILGKSDKQNTYQVKLFTNGRIQIPGIRDEYFANDILNEILNIMIIYIKNHSNILMFRDCMSLDITNLTPILQNYKSVLLNDINNPNGNLLLDLHTFTKCFDSNTFPIYLKSTIFHPERYSGMLIKFSTPKIIFNNYHLDKFIEIVNLYVSMKTKKKKDIKNKINIEDSKIERVCKMIQNAWSENNKHHKKLKQKLTTIKLFKSGKINIDHANNRKQALLLKDIVANMLIKYWDEIIYNPDE
jgi:TATA-box binding protein (TBP) (component of TFIID and TFIIIB)